MTEVELKAQNFIISENDFFLKRTNPCIDNLGKVISEF